MMRNKDGLIQKGPLFRKHKSFVSQINPKSSTKSQSNTHCISNGKSALSMIKPTQSNIAVAIPPLTALKEDGGKERSAFVKNDQYDNLNQHTDVSSIAVDDILSVSQCFQAPISVNSQKANFAPSLSRLINERCINPKKIMPTFYTNLLQESRMKNVIQKEMSDKDSNDHNKGNQELKKGLVRHNTQPLGFKQSIYRQKALSTQNENSINDIDTIKDNSFLTSSLNNTALLLKQNSISTVKTSMTTNNNHRRTISLNLPSSCFFQSIISYSDILLIEDNLNDILSVLTLNHSPEDQCLQWFSNYFCSSLKNNYSEYFLNESNKKKIKAYSTLELLSVLLCYTLSTNKEVFKLHIKDLKAVFQSLHLNFLLLSKFILTKQKGNDSFYEKLNLMLRHSLTSIREKDIEEFFISTLITHNVNSISELFLRIIGTAFKESDEEELLYNYLNNAYNNRHMLLSDDVIRFLKEKIVKEDFERKWLKEKPKAPYLPVKSRYPYTIVLDLDETLICCFESEGNKKIKKDKNNAELELRPSLFDFLQTLKGKCEIVLFTAATQDYADTIIDVIEAKECYFDYRLYREHTLVVEGEYMKDLKKLGRPLSNLIIVDDKPQNFLLQKENGIHIKAFEGGEPSCKILMHLADILNRIFNDRGDTREGLVKYKKDILNKITLGFENEFLSL